MLGVVGSAFADTPRDVLDLGTACAVRCDPMKRTSTTHSDSKFGDFGV